MKKIILLFLVLSSFKNFAQIKGQVTDDKNITLPSVTIFIENTYNNLLQTKKDYTSLMLKRLENTMLFFNVWVLRPKK